MFLNYYNEHLFMNLGSIIMKISDSWLGWVMFPFLTTVFPFVELTSVLKAWEFRLQSYLN